MLLESKSPPLTEPTPKPKTTKYSWAILGLGTVLYLLATHGQWDLAIAPWLASGLLLRFTRTTTALKGFLAVWAVTAIGVLYLLFQDGMQVVGPMAAVSIPLGIVFVLPFTIDRLVNRHLTNGIVRSLVFPLAVVAGEYLIAVTTPMGTALSSLASTQHENLPLLQLASITGGYGVSFLVAWFASVANELAEQRLRWPKIRTIALTYVGILALTVIGGTIRLAFFAPQGETVRVSGVSVSRAADEASDQEREQLGDLTDALTSHRAEVGTAFAPVNEDLLKSTEREISAGAKIVVWPEGGAAVLEEDRQQFLDRVSELATKTGAYIEVGMAVMNQPGGKHAFRNEAVLVSPDEGPLWTYAKSYPVPFLDPIAPGDRTMPSHDSPYGRIANAICFDADFPALMRKARDVDLMLVPSNDWKEMGQTHTEKATLRAVENGYSLVRQDSNGLSRAIDPLGRTVAQADYFTTDQQTVVANVPTKGTRTLYGTVGDAFAWLSIAALAVLAVLAAVAVARRTRNRA
ncbi:apolipoprotein N-acyltransferase [Tenggerimyces flavus]|uniref:Apolipoprotein N-acyltransferase n=1 Tax=Tenggerimyces flavus TaxID=1708749 RepID=A0ABV7Y873_9ACTN|nr:nitrilase-related carbon-nitrogen hydrolase [Tenggerimyces flavus]MBM7783488.1 apolipoprotein N-acyltransferase [Tenggerimyces flavus]